MTPEEMVVRLGEEIDIRIGRGALDVWLRKRGWTFKEDRTCIGAGAGSLKRRREWFDAQPDLYPAKLVFIDDTGLSTKMSRLRGRSLRGQRCRSAVPHGHWKTTTITGALRL